MDFGSNFFPKKTQSGIYIMSSSEFRSFDKKIHQGTSHFKYLISRDLTLAFAVLHCTTQRTNLSVRSKIFCSSQIVSILRYVQNRPNIAFSRR